MGALLVDAGQLVMARYVITCETLVDSLSPGGAVA